MKLAGKVALVTGAAHRVGKAIALALAREGADLIVHYGRSAAAAQETAREIEALGRRAVTLQADLRSWEAAAALGRAALEAFGRVDILVNSASSFVSKEYLETSEEEFDLALDVNVRAPFVLSQVIAKAMIAGEGGTIVNIVDESAFYPWRTYVAHGVSKAALLALTRAQTLVLGPKVRVNAVCPGPVLKPPDYTDEAWEALRNTNPLHALGSAEQVAEAVLFLVAGPPFINGDCIVLDGGRMWQHQ
ncbi:MAG: SDR family oxidoreductase [Thermoflexales bacterium]|nr:SDR family oxidoreductase [Thermoflexales bacterium]MCX7938367.1 SDR family oxidoreductase [Thermoflexales bacterium]MDW8291636.1 SDR family oxidoreductase [Anaerolineae bacterium]